MRLETIKIKDLPSFLDSDEFKNMPVIPISKRRGTAHANNPRALPDDVALLLAYLENKMVGYLGFLSDDIFNGNQKLHLAWMSCIWVDPDTRGKGVAKGLLQKGFEIWDHKLLATEFTAPAKRLYDKMELFDDLQVNHGLRCYLRFNLAKLLPTSRPKLKSLSPLFKVSDLVLNWINNLRLSFYSKKQSDNIQVEYLNIFDSESIEFIESKNQGEFLKRSPNDLRWAIKYPWLGKEQPDKENSNRYHFSVYSEHFQFKVIKIKATGKVKAVLIISEREEAMKVPYCWLEKGFEKPVVKIIWQYMLRQGLSYLTIYQQSLVPFFQTASTPFYLKRPFSRHYLISKKIDKKNIPASVNIQDGDGDCAFT